MDRFLKRWTLRSVLLIALVLVVPLGQASAQTAPAGVSILAQEEPVEDLGPSNEALPPDLGEQGEDSRDRIRTEATGADTLDEHGLSPDINETPIGGNEGQ
jgi:hypothetical protein